LAVDQQLGEGAALRVAPELADPSGSLEIGSIRTWTSSVRVLDHRLDLWRGLTALARSKAMDASALLPHQWERLPRSARFLRGGTRSEPESAEGVARSSGKLRIGRWGLVRGE
jgi:hypothetical protein